MLQIESGRKGVTSSIVSSAGVPSAPGMILDTHISVTSCKAPQLLQETFLGIMSPFSSIIENTTKL